MMSPLPGAIAAKPGSATKPFFGIKPSVVSADGTPLQANEGGFLVIDQVRAWHSAVRWLSEGVADCGVRSCPAVACMNHTGMAGDDALGVQGP